jgi:fimbrial chaperone protein
MTDQHPAPVYDNRRSRDKASRRRSRATTSLHLGLRVAVLLGTTGAVMAGAASPARASSFTVNPIKIVLSEKERSSLLTVQNQSAEPLRFQVSVNGWSQSPSGEMMLSGTKDIVVYPSILTLAPGEQRKLRIGSTTPITGTEKSYRIFVEELPPLQTAKKPTSSEVKVLTKMGVPVFLEPAGATTQAAVENLSLSKGHLAFDVKNAGNVHFIASKIAVRALGAGGEAVHSAEVQGWYVLAGTVRHFDVEIPRAACERASAVSVDVPLEKGAATARIGTRREGCGP